MQLKYVDTKEEIIAINRKSKHIEPHLHNALEIVCVTSGSLELGVGQELYHMEKGDIGFVFPDVIHHYQVLTPGVNKATYLIASPFTIGKFAEIMQTMAPEYLHGGSLRTTFHEGGLDHDHAYPPRSPDPLPSPGSEHAAFRQRHFLRGRNARPFRTHRFGFYARFG